MKIFLFQLTGILLLQFFTFAIYADETGYEVELIIFEDTTARYLRSENWSYNDMLNNRKEDTKKPLKTDPQYRQLNWEGAKLATKLERLKSNSNFRILENRRWRQTGLDRENAFNIPIGDQADTANQGEADNETEVPAEFIDQPDPASLNGNVKLIMSRYLHFNVDLQYNRPQIDENGEAGMASFPIVNERRMRSKETHYIDHPLVGIIVLATPYKIKSATEKTDTTEYKTM